MWFDGFVMLCSVLFWGDKVLFFLRMGIVFKVKFVVILKKVYLSYLMLIVRWFVVLYYLFRFVFGLFFFFSLCFLLFVVLICIFLVLYYCLVWFFSVFGMLLLWCCYCIFGYVCICMNMCMCWRVERWERWVVNVCLVVVRFMYSSLMRSSYMFVCVICISCVWMLIEEGLFRLFCSVCMFCYGVWYWK